MSEYRALKEPDPTPKELAEARRLAELLDPPVCPSKRLFEPDPTSEEPKKAKGVPQLPEPPVCPTIASAFDSTLSKISSLYSSAIRLRLEEGLDRCECAQHLAISPATFDVILFRAMDAYATQHMKSRWAK